MGGIGSHGGHSYVVQSLAFAVSLVLPGGALLLVAGAYWERLQRNLRSRPVKQQGRGGVALAAECAGE